jgi:hypothetical protein
MTETAMTEISMTETAMTETAMTEAAMNRPTDESRAHVEPVGYTLLRRGDVHDFDFIAGDWSVQSRRLRARNGRTSSDEFAGVLHGTLHLGGVANVDEITFPTLGDSGMTVRNFDAEARQWSIRWVYAQTGKMTPPVVGGFAGDRGEFYGEFVDGGRPVKVRFVWTKRGPNAATWELAFSHGGGPWETNWTMSITRASAAALTSQA